LTIQYNNRLNRFCLENNLSFLDFATDTLDLLTNTVDKRYLNINPLDHHIEPSMIAPLLVQKLRLMGFY